MRPGYEAVRKFIDKNNGSPIAEDKLKDEAELNPHEFSPLTFKEELWSVLLDKTIRGSKGQG